MLFRRTGQILFIVIFCSLVSVAQTFTRAEYAVGSQPNSIVTADFNGDGVADLAVTNTGDGTVSILLGRGNGSFGPSSPVTVGASPTEIVAADFNSDGHPDLAIANSSAAVTLLLGNGDGSFRRTDLAVGAAQASLSAGDFNSDGKLDLAVAAGSNVQIMIGDGGGSFTAGASFATEVMPKQIRAADFNHDSKLDLAIGACCQGSDVTYGALYVYAGNGDGTFTSKFSSNQSDGTKLTVGDVTGDGLADLIMPYVGCHTPCDGVEVIVSNGNFSFTRFGGGGDDGGLYYAGHGPAAVADFNGDSKVEVASTARPGNSGNLKGNDYVLIWGVSSDGKFNSAAEYKIGTQTGPWGITTTDFNHDGKADLAVVESKTGKVAIFLNDTGLSSAQRTFDLTLLYSPQSITAGDTAKYGYNVEATNGVLPDIQVACSGLPTGATCSFGDTSHQSSAQGFLYIGTTAAKRAAVPHSAAWLAFALPFGFVVIPTKKRKLLWLGLIAIAFAVILEAGCATGGKNLMNAQSPGSSATTTTTGNSGGNAGGTTSGGTDPSYPPAGSAPGPTPSGTYQITVTATGGDTTQSQVITLIVQ